MPPSVGTVPRLNALVKPLGNASVVTSVAEESSLRSAIVLATSNRPSGAYEGILVKNTPNGAVVGKAKSFGLDRVYQHEKKQYAEIAAFEIIDGLLQAFVEAYVDIRTNGEAKASFKSQRLHRLMGDMKPDASMPAYDALMRINDFVSGMTDRYAVGVFRQIKGIALGSLTPAPQGA